MRFNVLDLHIAENKLLNKCLVVLYGINPINI